MTGGEMSDWRDQIRRGNILLSRGGTERVVRSVKMRPTGQLFMVSFVILSCSWTGRCHTVRGRSDLRTEGYRPTGRRYKIKKHGMDKKIQREIDKVPHPDKIKIHCCDVEGIR